MYGLLNAILGYSEILLENADAAGDTSAVTDLRRIELAAVTMARASAPGVGSRFVVRMPINGH
jgi:hypothetical protein